jgi:hypothetical protein
MVLNNTNTKNKGEQYQIDNEYFYSIAAYYPKTMTHSLRCCCYRSTEV